MSHASRPRDLKRNMKRALKTRPEIPPFKKNTRKAVDARNLRAAEWSDFEERRKHVSERRQEALDSLNELHARLREKWASNGVTVHEAVDAEQARRIVLGIVQKSGVDRVLKSKSMLSEEIEINNALKAAGIESVETDLGEYIVQLRDEPPSHITMPGMHLTRVDVGKLFAEKLGVEYTEDPPALTQIARRTLRKQFLESEVGMVGVNFAVAETGHIITVTNEGNGRMVTTLPRVVIALMGWERVTQSMSDLAQLWQLLSRSATGQRASVYLNMMQGPDAENGGPEEVHVVVVDNGRQALEREEVLREVLRCIRCGACLNACPVYQQVGGHPYGGTYPGPIGSVVTPALWGIESAPDHPFASSLCGACEEVCPVSIPIPEMLLKLRQGRVDHRRWPDPEGTLWGRFRWVMDSRRVYEAASGMARNAQKLWPGRGKKMVVPGWTDHRDAPVFAPKPFRTVFAESKKKRSK